MTTTTYPSPPPTPVMDDPAAPSSAQALLQDGNLAALRNVLLVQERAQLKALRRRLDDPATRAAEVAAILPAALALSDADNDKIADALVPVVQTALAQSLRDHPDLLLTALRTLLGETLRAPFRLLRSFLHRPPRRRHLPARITHLYLLDRLTGALLEQQLRTTPTDEPPDELDARATASMITYLLAFLREPEHLARYAALQQLRIEHRTYAIFAGAQKVLLAVLEGRMGLEAEVAACEQMLIEADQGHPLPPASVGTGTAGANKTAGEGV
jgi:hypothetical protein